MFLQKFISLMVQIFAYIYFHIYFYLYYKKIQKSAFCRRSQCRYFTSKKDSKNYLSDLYNSFFFFFFFFFSILNMYTCKHKIYNHQSYIYLICLGIYIKKKTIIVKIKMKIPKKRNYKFN